MLSQIIYTLMLPEQHDLLQFTHRQHRLSCPPSAHPAKLTSVFQPHCGGMISSMGGGFYIMTLL